MTTGHNTEPLANGALARALREIEAQSPQQTDGKWLEQLTVECAPLIAEWDIRRAWAWTDWPGRNEPGSPWKDSADIGIDAVAERSSDWKLIAIQCKSRKLDAEGRGTNIGKSEFDSFLAASGDGDWAERWLVVNGDVRLSHNSEKTAGRRVVKLVNVESDIRKQMESVGERMSRDEMQAECIEASTRILREHAKNNPNGRARGRIILPCGTGKSRIALRIIEDLTGPGQVSAILCPSIALVAQLRREFLAHRKAPINALAVCSDEGVARDRDLASDPTADLGPASVAEIKGAVTTDPQAIREWMEEVAGDVRRIGVLFGTYQSSCRIAEALDGTGEQIRCMVADEAHRTAGLRRVKKLETKLRDFTVCHDDQKIPAKYRVYQTATPKVYGESKKLTKARDNTNWVVRDMADESVFGPELYRRSYADAVKNGWLTDYKIIAIGVNDEDAYRTANGLAGKHGKKLSTAHLLKGMALALLMGGALRRKGVAIRSSINFMNLIAKSKEMTKALNSDAAREWVQGRLDKEGVQQKAARYRMEHLDASSKVTERENAKARLMGATDTEPHGIVNVGIFGEGVDAPSLSAVGFLEARKSPVDVIQAVGRVMRSTKGKQRGYILCPVLIPPGTDAETWLRNSGPQDGWRELGQILLALRAHDSRIEDQLSKLMEVYLPPEPEGSVATHIVLGTKTGRASHYGHVGKPGTAEKDVTAVLENKPGARKQLRPLGDVLPTESASNRSDPIPPASGLTAERIVSGKKLADGALDLREAGTVRTKPSADGTPGPVHTARTKKLGRKMLNGVAGQAIPKWPKKPKKKPDEYARGLFDEVEDVGISVNLLARSGLARNHAERDVNILESSINEARRCLLLDELDGLLNRHFGLDKLADAKLRKQADGCTIASLLLMNAAMLHERIAAGGWLHGIAGLDEIKNATDPLGDVLAQWNKITRHDFLPVIEPAVEILEAVRKHGRLDGVNRALRHLASEAEQIAAHYADLGADHAGPLFNRVMGNQASDGAFFTRPPAAAILARLTLDAAGDADWTQDKTWKQHKTIDLACGSGTLIAAMLTDMKRRAKEQGGSERRLAKLHKLAVEETIAGLDFNEVSLQLAAAQLTAGNRDVAYRKMRLHRMPYGPFGYGVRVGSLELLGQRSLLRSAGLDFDDQEVGSKQLRMAKDDPLLEDACDAAKNTRIVVMNPPFTNRTNLGEKFPKETQRRLRERVDSFERTLISADAQLEGFAGKNSIGPLFDALADKCLDPADGLLAMVNPTIALTNTSRQIKRAIFAKRFHIHTLLTCHRPGQINLSQNTAINESIVIARRHEGERPPTRVISLDRFPADEHEVGDLHRCLSGCVSGLLPDGWGEVSEWSAERIEAGDWSAVAFRSPGLAEAAVRIARDGKLLPIVDQNIVPSAVLQGGAQMRALEKVPADTPGSFPVLYSKGAEAQTRIRAMPDKHLVSTKPTQPDPSLGRNASHAEKLHQHAGHLLVTEGQRTSTGRLTAVASEIEYIGVGWMPIRDITFREAKAVAVFLNSTAGRLQLLRNPGKSLDYPKYRPGTYEGIEIPDLTDEKAVLSLAMCWDRTHDMIVPQFRDGECEVRRLWDEAVAEALGWDTQWLAELRQQLHDEPHVRGFGRGQFGE